MTIADLIQYEPAPGICLYAAELGLALTFGYCLADKDSGTALIIDAPQYADEIFGQICEREGYTVAAILLTHTHWDHTATAAALKRRFGAPLYVHQSDRYRLVEPNAHTVWKLPFEIESAEPDIFFEDKDLLTFGKFNVEVRHTPGHTEGGVCFWERNLELVFSGDTLFADSIGRTDLPGGNMDELLESIQRELLTLPDDTEVFPGHGDPTTIGTERLSNPFLRR